MAITWGSTVKNSGGNSLRVGIDMTQSPSSVSAGTSSVKVTAKIYVRTGGAVNYSGAKLSLSGSWSGSYSISVSHGSGGGTTLVKTVTRTVSPSYTGTTSSSLSASVSGLYNFGAARHSRSVTTGKRPISKPSAPSSVKADRYNDNRFDISWKNNSSTSAPYTNIYVDRSTNGGSYSNIAKLSGGSTSYRDTTTAGNQRYRYRIAARNSAGGSGHTYSTYVVTTPARPPAPSVKVSGSSIIVSTGTNLPRHTNQIEIYDYRDGSSSGVKVATLSASTGSNTNWTYTDPDARVTHAFTVRARAGASGDTTGFRWSAQSPQSDTVSLATDPGTIPSVRTASQPRALTLTFSWDQPNLGNAALIRYEVQVWNGSSWGDVISTGTTRNYSLPKAYPGVGYKIRVRVMTAVSTSSWRESPLVTNGFCSCHL